MKPRKKKAVLGPGVIAITIVTASQMGVAWADDGGADAGSEQADAGAEQPDEENEGLPPTCGATAMRGGSVVLFGAGCC